ncbi:isocitrate lyase/phosphoenolpyruvate mutase family protein [Ilyomonas limi]|uniref:Isocitrate lyase/phosphoenolpyruvate mutase family protein n=1 Tax=Ilyomonas limi TaxID=2575867 RepID=A0A4U3L7G0_9BACT|nr:isocitrate lyase/phosphoenolpyruvate mutase family protein [Ilyomonas limi]TKK71000.1 isocitrate lyase/phosphoenolpyruvate mutase family protein [Ilyomonas limi]
MNNTTNQTQQAKANTFKSLHHNGQMLVLPNIWDPLGASLLQSLGYVAVATASASIAFTNGYDDGEHIPFTDLLRILKRIVNSVTIPVTADIESGYADNNASLETNIKQLIDTGIVGINIEDTNKQNGQLLSIEAQCEKIQLIRKIASEMEVPLFINARTDVYLKAKAEDTAAEKWNETLKRGKAYIAAGGDCFFPVFMKEKHDIATLVAQLKAPVNIIAVPGVQDLKILKDVGVARVSIGPSFLRTAILAMKELALTLKDYEGLDMVTNNPITTNHLKALVNH